MYKRFIEIVFICNLILMLGTYKGWTSSREITSALQENIDLSDMKKEHFFFRLHKAESGQRVVQYNVLEKTSCYDLTEKDLEALYKIVQAEAGGEDEEGKMMVAGVVLNRMKSKKFPNTVESVVLQNDDGIYQFSPVANGRYYSVKVSKETKKAVQKVLLGENPAGEALYFAARKYADAEKMKWFDANLTLLYKHGGHEFFG